MGLIMIQQQISAADPIDIEIRRALEDAGPDIAEWRAVTARLARHIPNSDKHRADAELADELMSRIQSRAERIEIGEGGLTAAGLIAYAISAQRVVVTGGSVEQALGRQYSEEYAQCVANTTAAQRAFAIAERNLTAAKRAEASALENYRAHGASRLVR